MSLRMPRKAHEAVKTLARNRAQRAADLYVKALMQHLEDGSGTGGL